MTSAGVAVTARAGYLTQKHFLYMLSFAGFIHLIAMIIAALSAGSHASKIPVHVMNIKLGTSELMAQAPDAMGAKENVRRTVDLSSMPLPTLPPVAPQAKSASPSSKVPAKENAPVVKRKVAKPKPEMLAPARDQKTTTSAETQYVREDAVKQPEALPAGDPNGTLLGNSTNATAEVMQRYTQQISLWLQRHQVYPDGLRSQGISGNAIIRLRIDRTGRIKFFRIEQSTGNAELDDAVVAMVRAANPVPAVPANYPAGNLVEFLIPVNYNLR